MTLVVVAWLAILGLIGAVLGAAALSIERKPRKEARKRWAVRRQAPAQIRVMSESKADGSLL